MYIIKHESGNPYFNLAVEEYLLDNFDEDIIMLWRNDNAVVVGKNQNTIQEINQNYVDENGIRVVRRLTGGGAVFHDMGNVNYTIIQKYDNSLFSNYEYFTKSVRDFLRTLGVDARLSGRNDLMIDGKKFSGNAQCVRNGKMMHHGTLMFSSQVKDISGALTPNKQKIESKGVKSVKSHVTNISSHMENKISVDEFLERLYEHYLTSSENVEPYQFTQADIAAIQKLSDDKYATWDWNYGESPAYSWSGSKKYDFGLVDIRMDIKNGTISDVRIYGDFFGIKNIRDIETLLTGSLHRYDQVAEKLDAVEIGDYISGMTKEQLLGLLFDR
ncbi:lipoate--protein ligase [bacterium 210820-DFI.6.37]|nr:lipoate--protein ligase [bacterium 210820-DFI.6.37]